MRTEQIRFQQTVQPLQGIRDEDFVPLDGRITSVCIHWPLNCNALVDVAVGHGHKQFMPIGGFLALNDATPVFACSEDCKRNETVWAIIQNTDGFAAHTISVIITIEGD